MSEADVLSELDAYARSHGALKAGLGRTDDVLGFIRWYRAAYTEPSIECLCGDIFPTVQGMYHHLRLVHAGIDFADLDVTGLTGRPLTGWRRWLRRLGVTL